MEFFEKLNDVAHFLVWFHFYFFLVCVWLILVKSLSVTDTVEATESF